VTQCFDYFTWILLAQGLPLTFLMNFLFWRYYKLKDPYKIKTEFAAQYITGIGMFGGWIILQIYDTVTGGMKFYPNFAPMYIISLFCYNATICNLMYPVYLAYKESKMDLGLELHHTSSNTSSRRNSTDLTVKNILENETLFAAFKDTTIEYWCVETLLFVVAVDHYKKITEGEREKEAKKIYNVFLQEESQLFVNVNDAESKKIQGEIQAARFTRDLFDGCYKDVMGQLEGILLRWKTTEQYKEVLSQANFRNSNSITNPSRESINLQMDQLNV